VAIALCLAAAPACGSPAGAKSVASHNPLVRALAAYFRPVDGLPNWDVPTQSPNIDIVLDAAVTLAASHDLTPNSSASVAAFVATQLRAPGRKAADRTSELGRDWVAAELLSRIAKSAARDRAVAALRRDTSSAVSARLATARQPPNILAGRAYWLSQIETVIGPDTTTVSAKRQLACAARVAASRIPMTSRERLAVAGTVSNLPTDSRCPAPAPKVNQRALSGLLQHLASSANLLDVANDAGLLRAVLPTHRADLQHQLCSALARHTLGLDALAADGNLSQLRTIATALLACGLHFSLSPPSRELLDTIISTEGRRPLGTTVDAMQSVFIMHLLRLLGVPRKQLLDLARNATKPQTAATDAPIIIALGTDGWQHLSSAALGAVRPQDVLFHVVPGRCGQAPSVLSGGLGFGTTVQTYTLTVAAETGCRTAKPSLVSAAGAELDPLVLWVQGEAACATSQQPQRPTASELRAWTASYLDAAKVQAGSWDPLRAYSVLRIEDMKKHGCSDPPWWAGLP
jgi:hypothetical protein